MERGHQLAPGTFEGEGEGEGEGACWKSQIRYIKFHVFATYLALIYCLFNNDEVLRGCFVHQPPSYGKIHLTGFRGLGSI